MILDIIKYGDSNYNKLRAKNVDVIKENPKLEQLINDMFETLDKKGGIGLAAPQVGHNINLFVVKLENLKEVFINPKIITEGLNIQIREGCLSFPGMEFPVNRQQKVKVKFFDKNWTLRQAEYKDMEAIVIQHEYDHLIGKLIID